MIPSSTVTPGVELHDLTIGYTRRRALRRGTVTEVASGLSAVARRGELTALVGPNGAGKSTLLRTLCGLQPALRGRVLIDGEDVATVKPADLATRISVVLTERIDPGLLTVRELVALAAHRTCPPAHGCRPKIWPRWTRRSRRRRDPPRIPAVLRTVRRSTATFSHRPCPGSGSVAARPGRTHLLPRRSVAGRTGGRPRPSRS